MDRLKLEGKANPAMANKPFTGCVTTNGGEPIGRGPVYYAKTLVDGEVKEIFATQEEVLAGGANFDLQPLVFYRMTGPVADFASLPAIDADKVFHRSADANEFLRFSISNEDIDAAEIMDIEV